MKCESFRNRLLALPSPDAPTPELTAHLATCAGCRVFAARAGKLDALIAALPVPSSEAKKAEFMASLTALGPVIQTKPTVPSADRHSGTFRPFRALARKVDWRYAASLAAVLALAVSAWLLWPTGGKLPVAEKTGPRQELLAKQGKHLAALASADTADVRLRVWADWTTDLRATTADVYKAADPADFDALERMFVKAVRDGVVKQASQLPQHMTAAERVAALEDARRKLNDARAELERLRQDAPAGFKTGLDKMTTQAREAQETLAKLAKGGAT